MGYWKDIYTYEDLDSLIVNGIISESFWVNSTVVNKLLGVREIKIEKFGTVHFKNLIDIGELESINCNFSFWGKIESLNNLKYVGGELRFGAPLKSLGKLEKIEGDLRPTTNELVNLGNLKHIGGTADFRGMENLNDLGKLEFVVGNLNLVKSLKGKYDLNKIKVKGNIVYWNKKPEYFIEETLLNEKTAPPWESEGPTAFEQKVVIPNKEQREFYEYFKASFYNGNFVDVGGMRNYIRYFIFNLVDEYEKNKDFITLKKTFAVINKNYSNISQDTYDFEIEIGRKLGITEYLNEILPWEAVEIWRNKVNEFLQKTIYKVSEFSDDVDLCEILIIGYKNEQLTKFGQDNFDEILLKLILFIREMELEDKSPFSRKFFDKNKFHKTSKINSEFDPEYYAQFFSTKEEFDLKRKIYNDRNRFIPKENISNPKYFTVLLQFAILSYLKELIKECENNLREERGLPKIGEGWISETNLFYKIKNSFPDCIVLHHGKPMWLGRQHFDIYFPEYNIAIEYQGAQHFEIVGHFGGEESYITTVQNDRLKKDKCIMNGCHLIEVLPNYNIDDLVNEINSHIKLTNK